MKIPEKLHNGIDRLSTNNLADTINDIIDYLHSLKIGFDAEGNVYTLQDGEAVKFTNKPVEANKYHIVQSHEMMESKKSKKKEKCTHNYGAMGVGCMPDCELVESKIPESDLSKIFNRHHNQYSSREEWKEAIMRDLNIWKYATESELVAPSLPESKKIDRQQLATMLANCLQSERNWLALADLAIEYCTKQKGE